MYDFQSINVNANESKWNKSATIHDRAEKTERKSMCNVNKASSWMVVQDYGMS